MSGFGFENDGSTDTLFRFLQSNFFDASSGNRVGFVGDAQRRDVEQFLLAYDNDLDRDGDGMLNTVDACPDDPTCH